ncbi:hypothetical protein [Microcoleus sp. herbarium2]|uniref:hypothetical protein n=1 Tax=Microcoleus sp. herbarium2 TaxID=3055433 RepID=UPI002FD02C25
MNSTKKQQVDREMQAESRTFSDTVRENAVPAKACIIPVFVQHLPDFIRHLSDFNAPQQLAIF